MTKIKLLTRKNADCEALSSLHGASFAERWSTQSIEGLLDSAGVFAAAAYNGSELWGFVIARAAADEAEILTLAVQERARRRGAGRALVIAAAQQAEERGAHVLFLEVGRANVPARGLYEALGFRVVGERKGYYRDTEGKPKDALTLRTDLPLALGKGSQVD